MNRVSLVMVFGSILMLFSGCQEPKEADVKLSIVSQSQVKVIKDSSEEALSIDSKTVEPSSLDEDTQIKTSDTTSQEVFDFNGVWESSLGEVWDISGNHLVRGSTQDIVNFIKVNDTTYIMELNSEGAILEGDINIISNTEITISTDQGMDQTPRSFIHVGDSEKTMATIEGREIKIADFYGNYASDGRLFLVSIQEEAFSYQFQNPSGEYTARSFLDGDKSYTLESNTLVVTTNDGVVREFTMISDSTIQLGDTNDILHLE